MRWLLFILPVCVWSAGPKLPQGDFDKLVDRYFDDFYHYNPTHATSDGFHQYDAQLEDHSLAAMAARIRSLERFLTEFEHFPASSLSPGQGTDRDLVVHAIRSQLLELENIRPWEKGPDKYSSSITNSAFVIMSRSFAPPEERLKSLS